MRTAALVVRCWLAILGSAAMLSIGWAQAPAEPPKKDPSAAAAGPLAPEATLERFVLPAGLAIELVAAEPLVVDPVAISFDDQGRMFAVEYRDYPLGPPAGQPPLSRVRLLTDTDGDGRMDTSSVFAEGLSFAQGVLAIYGGALVTAAPDILFLKDTDGDGKADSRQVVLTGFKEGNPQLRVAHPRRGLDGWIYVTNGLSGGEVHTPDGATKLEMGKSDLRFRFTPGVDGKPITPVQMELVAGTGQFGQTFDDWGNRFFCSNRNPVMYAPLTYQAAARNPFAVIPVLHEDVAPFGGEAKVYPLVDLQTTAVSHAGTHTAACGVHIYRGDALDGGYKGNVFVCEPTGSLVTRSLIEPKGVSFTTKRAEPGRDFLCSTDPWFRPVSLADGPDGCLYVVDMYREVIEHPQYMPAGLAETLNLRGGDDRGRVYRIRPTQFQRSKFVPPATADDAVGLLTSPNGWHRDLGLRRLAESDAGDASLRKLLHGVRSGANPIGRLLALYALSVSGLEPGTFSAAYARAEQDPRVRVHAARLAAETARWDNRALRTMLVELRREQASDPPLAMELLLAAGEIAKWEESALIAEIASSHVNNVWFRRATLAATQTRAGDVLARLLAAPAPPASKPAFGDEGSPEKIELISGLSSIVGARGESDELNVVLERVARESEVGAWWQTAVLTGLAQGLARHEGPLGKTSLAKLLAEPPAPFAAHAERASTLLAQSTKLASDAKRPAADRVAAARLLAWLPAAEAEPALDGLLTASVPPAVQLAAIDALRTGHYDRSPPILFKHWNTLSPATRSAAVDLLLGKPATTLPFLQAMVDGKISASVVGLERRDALLRHGQADIKKLAQDLFGGQVSANRKAVAEQYAAALTAAAADATRGQAVFKRICAACHKVRGEGHDIGPDITDVRNKTRETLLYDILDPNRAVEPRWVGYVATTTDGRAVTGLLASETANTIVLRRAEGKEDVLVRSEIEELQATGKSLMPEGVEKDITVEQMADLLEFLKARATPGR